MMMETLESGRAVVLEFSTSLTPSFTHVARRIRKRLLVECKNPTIEEIEAKLQHANLPRQQTERLRDVNSRQAFENLSDLASSDMGASPDPMKLSIFRWQCL